MGFSQVHYLLAKSWKSFYLYTSSSYSSTYKCQYKTKVYFISTVWKICSLYYKYSYANYDQILHNDLLLNIHIFDAAVFLVPHFKTSSVTSSIALAWPCTVHVKFIVALLSKVAFWRSLKSKKTLLLFCVKSVFVHPTVPFSVTLIVINVVISSESHISFPSLQRFSKYGHRYWVVKRRWENLTPPHRTSTYIQTFWKPLLY